MPIAAAFWNSTALVPALTDESTGANSVPAPGCRRQSLPSPSPPFFLANPADSAPEGERPPCPASSNPFDGGIALTSGPLGVRVSPAEIGAADAVLLGALTAVTLPEAKYNDRGENALAEVAATNP